MKQQRMEVWNFVVQFGDERLLDRYKELVEPAFFESMERRFGYTRYLFKEVAYVNAAPPGKAPQPAIAGRFVKDTVLHQEQELVNGQLRPATGQMPSAPSSFFVLTLATHRLLLVREHRGAPTAEQLATTVEGFVRKARKRRIQQLHDESIVAGHRRTKKDLESEMPRPEISVMPVVEERAIEAFVAQFAKIRHVSVTIAPTNEEPDGNQFFEDLRKHKEAIKADKARVEYRSTDGLDADQTIAQVKAAKDGLAEFKLEGDGVDGNKISGNNEKLQVRVPLDVERHEVAEKAEDVLDAFQGLVDSGAIGGGPTDGATHATILGLASRLFGGR